MERWFQDNTDKALCIFGARQIGKTTSAMAFGQSHFERTIKIDFLRQPEAAAIFSDTADPSTLLMRIELLTGESIIDGSTLILLDEIQECPQARTAIKYLVQDGRCRYIETGSLLGVRLSEIRSFPVGFEQPVTMYPLDFEEFLWACSIPQGVLDLIFHCFQEQSPLPDYEHQKLQELFLTYVVVGGMPEAVVRYRQTNSILAVSQTQREIWQLYALDITKYAKRTERTRILELFDSVPSQLNSSNLRFYLSQASDKKKPQFEEYQGALTWLTQAGIVLPCFNITAPEYPLKLNEKRRLFRLYTLDSGLLSSQFDGIQLKILKLDPTLNWGSILENTAAQILAASDFSLYYQNMKNFGELDFVIEEGSEITLIELKSGKDYTRHRALDHALSQKKWPVKNAYVFCRSNVQIEGRVTYLPWYMMMCIQKPAVTEEFPFSFEGLSFNSDQ